ncbi:CLP1-like protein [Drosera capensis]
MNRIKRERERIEVSETSPLRLRLLSGSTEIFGPEIPPEIWLNFPPRLKFAVFTWYGATIEMDGAIETDYTADAGPRVIDVGPTDSGKSTLSRMLLSWAAKQGWKPTYVDLDIGQGSLTIPGCIAATPIELPIDPVEGIPLEMPLVYYYGHATPIVHVDLYKVIVKELPQTLGKQFAGNTESRAAGMLLLHAIDAFNADFILVLGQEKLWSMLKEVHKSKPRVDVVKLQKSGGVVSRNAKYRQKSRGYRIREYVYGISNDLCPHSNVANFSDLSVYKIGGGPHAPRSALPIGAEPATDPTRVVQVNISQDLLHLVLAVSFAKDADQILSRRKITYLAPSAGELPSTTLIHGSLAWRET